MAIKTKLPVAPLSLPPASLVVLLAAVAVAVVIWRRNSDEITDGPAARFSGLSLLAARTTARSHLPTWPSIAVRPAAAASDSAAVAAVAGQKRPRLGPVPATA